MLCRLPPPHLLFPSFLIIKMSIAIVFSQFGPYHHARVLGLQGAGIEILPVQIAEASRTYAWTRNAATVDGIISLTPGAEEDAGFVSVFTAACKLWRRERVRVAFLPSYFPATSLALLFSAKLVGVKCIMMNESHAGTEQATGLKRRVKKLLVSLFDGAILGGTPQLRHFESLGMCPRRMVTGYDAIDNDYFSEQSRNVRESADECRERLFLPQRYLLSLGRMVEKKNLKTLVEAYALVRKERRETDLKLVFVGSGECQGELVRRCDELGLLHTDKPGKDVHADVFFYGFRQIDENPVFYALAEAFVLPSLHEEWGLVVNEAMACGLPILVSKEVGSAEDLVVDGLNGFHFSPASAVQLADKVMKLHDDPVLRERMGKASAARIDDWGCENFALKAREILALVGVIP